MALDLEQVARGASVPIVIDAARRSARASVVRDPRSTVTGSSRSSSGCSTTLSSGRGFGSGGDDEHPAASARTAATRAVTTSAHPGTVAAAGASPPVERCDPRSPGDPQLRDSLRDPALAGLGGLRGHDRPDDRVLPAERQGVERGTGGPREGGREVVGDLDRARGVVVLDVMLTT